MRRVLQLVALGALLTFTAMADDIVLDFEGIPNGDVVGNYFNGEVDGNGFGPGPSDGVTFSSGSAYVSDDVVGNENGGTFGGDPIGDESFTATNGSPIIMNVAAGFTTGFSFYYSSPFDAISDAITIYSGLDGGGSLLATISLGDTGNGNALGNPACPNSWDTFCPFFAIGVDIPTGTAESVEFTGTFGLVAFDDFTLGSDIPATSEPGALKMLGLGLACLLAVSRRRRKLQQDTGRRFES
jgi:hypothetical protein